MLDHRDTVTGLAFLGRTDAVKPGDLVTTLGDFLTADPNHEFFYKAVAFIIAVRPGQAKHYTPGGDLLVLLHEDTIMESPARCWTVVP